MYEEPNVLTEEDSADDVSSSGVILVLKILNVLIFENLSEMVLNVLNNVLSKKISC